MEDKIRKNTLIPVIILITLLIVSYHGLSIAGSGNIIQNNSDPEYPEMISLKTIEIEKEIFKKTNETRKMSGMKSLKRNPQLDKVARNHSIDMIKSDFFSHINLYGQTPTDRAKAQGFKVGQPRKDRSIITDVAENIGKMPTGLVLYRGYVEDTPEAVAAALVKSWMARPGHRVNILRDFSLSIGIGVAFDGKFYVATQLFH